MSKIPLAKRNEQLTKKKVERQSLGDPLSRPSGRKTRRGKDHLMGDSRLKIQKKIKGYSQALMDRKLVVIRDDIIE